MFSAKRDSVETGSPNSIDFPFELCLEGLNIVGGVRYNLLQTTLRGKWKRLISRATHWIPNACETVAVRFP